MSPPALIVCEDDLNSKWSNEELQRLSVFARENSNPNFNIVVKNAALQNQHTLSSVLSSPSVKDESFRMVLPQVMSPPRDKAVPLPVLPEPMMKPQKKTRKHKVIKKRLNLKQLNVQKVWTTKFYNQLNLDLVMQMKL